VGALFADIEAAAPEAAIFGSDLSPGMLRLADPRFGRVVMDATELGFASGSFDVVTMCFMLFHVPDPAAALNEAKRVLRPGGSLGVITWRGESTYPALEVWTEALDRHGAAPSEQIATRHELVDSPAKLESLLGDTGFVDLRSWTADLNEVLDLESFIEARTRLGRCKRRFEFLDVATRQSCLRHARLRLEAMGSDDFVDRSTAIFVTATKSST
jgi:SAM-dependent methyltransferase